MLAGHVERYVTLRQTLGFELHDTARHLRHFARFADERGDTHVRASTALEWAAAGTSPHVRYVRLRCVAQLARFLHAEDPAHEIPPRTPFARSKGRRKPYIYTPDEIARLLAAARRLRVTYPLRRHVYTTLLGLIAATGLRISEALDLLLDDVSSDGILRIRNTKFGKTRLVPLHPTVVGALRRYLDVRRKAAITDQHVFLSAGNTRISSTMADFTFRRILVLSGVGSGERRPRIHDLRHTFATRALEQCDTRREAVGRHFVALATYLGHAEIANTYWYLSATPELMSGMATAAETLVARKEARS